MKQGMTFEIEGTGELEKQLEKIGKSLEDKRLEPIMLARAEKVRDRIIQKAPLGPTGNLRRSPIAKLLSRRAGYPTTAIAGIDRKIAPHAHLVEFGTVKMPAHPFFRPAVDEMRDVIMGEIREECKDLVEKSV